MGVFEKLKNALFEVEYVEEEETKKEKKIKPKDSNNDNSLDENKPIAKKIVLPGKKEEKVEEIKEEDLMDEDFEVRPKDSLKTVADTFKYLDDEDFKVDEEPVIVEKIPQAELVAEKTPVQDSFVQPAPQPAPAAYTPSIVEAIPSSFNNDYVKEYDSYKQRVNVDDYKVSPPKESKPYGLDPSNQLSIKKYGSYENKDEKAYFKPSPIISPIYGILDKNYKKEDVVPKKNVRISNYSRSSVNVDDVRNKAFAEKEEILEEEVFVKQVEVEEEDDNLLVDLSNEREKPEVKEITVGDAMEYFNDLGLEYNVDYVDVSNKKKKDSDLTDDIKMNMEPVESLKAEETPKEVQSTKVTKKRETPVVEVMDESSNPVDDDDDNLFDLIDSMYKEDR